MRRTSDAAEAPVAPVRQMTIILQAGLILYN